VAFISEGEVVLTGDNWRAIINFDLSPYTDAIGVLRADLATIHEIAERTTPVVELRHVETALTSLERKLASVKQFMPKTSRKRGLLNAGGIILKTVFGTATEMDLGRVRAAVDHLAGQHESVAHSIEQQLTYFKHLDNEVRNNQQVVTLLSSTLKGYAVKIQDTFQEVAAKLEWGAKQRERAATIRQIEFSLNVLEASIDGLMEALQTVISEKIPVRLISPGTLLGITKNVSLTLPAGYQLVAGTSPASMSWYEFVKTTMVASTQGFLLVLSFLLADSSRKFDLLNIHTFPSRLFNNTFAQYQVGREYLAVNLLQHTYFTMTEGERQQCQGFSLKVCPVSRPVYSTQVENCALSLYFQRPSVRELCNRSVRNQQLPPILLRSGQVLLYHFAEPRRVYPVPTSAGQVYYILGLAGCQRHQPCSTLSRDDRGGPAVSSVGWRVYI
jgi:hypothetical protein